MTTELDTARKLPEYPLTVPLDEATVGELPGDEAIPFDVEAIRADFPILERTTPDGQPLVYLDSANTSQKPRVVVEAIEDHYLNHNANVARAMHLLGAEATEAFEGARATLVAFLGAERSEEIVFTKNASEALNLCAHTLGAGLQPGDEIVISVMEHHSNIVPWQMLASRTGAVLRWYDVTEEGRLDLEGAVRDGLLNERTKIVSIAYVSNVLGTVNPVTEIAAAAHAVGAVLVVDASQAVPQLPVDVATLGADLLVFTGHKMVGPTGIGVLWGRYDLLAELPPFLGGGEMIEVVKMTGSTYAPPPHRFEAGTPPIAQAVGLATAASYLSDLGMAQIAAHEQEITAYALEGLATIPGLRILGPSTMQDRGGALSFTLTDAMGDQVHPHDVSQLLDSRGIAVRGGHHCARPLHERFGVQSSTRASFYLYTTRAEIDALVDALEYTMRFFGRTAAGGTGMKVEELYQEIILDHYRAKHHSGLRDPYEVEVHHVNPSCGDEVTLRIHVEDGRVSDVSYDGQGCSISQASTSVMTDLVIGLPVTDGLELHQEFLTLMQSKGTLEPDEDRLEDAIAFAGVSKFPARVKCALLGWSAFKDAALQASAHPTDHQPGAS